MNCARVSLIRNKMKRKTACCIFSNATSVAVYKEKKEKPSKVIIMMVRKIEVQFYETDTI